MTQGTSSSGMRWVVAIGALAASLLLSFALFKLRQDEAVDHPAQVPAPLDSPELSNEMMVLESSFQAQLDAVIGSSRQGQELGREVREDAAQEQGDWVSGQFFHWVLGDPEKLVAHNLVACLELNPGKKAVSPQALDRISSIATLCRDKLKKSTDIVGRSVMLAIAELDQKGQLTPFADVLLTEEEEQLAQDRANKMRAIHERAGRPSFWPDQEYIAYGRRWVIKRKYDVLGQRSSPQGERLFATRDQIVPLVNPYLNYREYARCEAVLQLAGCFVAEGLLHPEEPRRLCAEFLRLMEEFQEDRKEENR